MTKQELNTILAYIELCTETKEVGYDGFIRKEITDEKIEKLKKLITELYKSGKE